jgi:hypothetical protein
MWCLLGIRRDWCCLVVGKVCAAFPYQPVMPDLSFKIEVPVDAAAIICRLMTIKAQHSP